jgi:hypothetical protein
MEICVSRFAQKNILNAAGSGGKGMMFACHKLIHIATC